MKTEEDLAWDRWVQLPENQPMNSDRLDRMWEECVGGQPSPKVEAEPYKTFRRNLKKSLTQERAAREEAQRRLDSSTLRDAVTSVALKAGAKRNAVEFLVTQAQNVFEVVEGVVRSKGNAYSKANPGELLSVPEWMTGATKEFDFAFEPSGGGNTGPTSGMPEGVPGAKQLVDPTPQQLGKFADQISAGELIVVNTVDALI
jgi:hypothetical protein